MFFAADTYTNPIIDADYSDPDVIRVGDDFYLTASSFNSIPGLPILHSRDLVNWNLHVEGKQRCGIVVEASVDQGRERLDRSVPILGRRWKCLSGPCVGQQ